MFPLFKRNSVNKYLFICGCGHSGTSLVLAIFNNLDNVYVFNNETGFFLGSKKKTIKDFKKYTIKNINYDCQLVVEKTPKHVRYCSEILSDEDTEILVMIRNPFDNIASLIKRGYDIKDAISRYEIDNLSWRKFKNSKRLEYLKYEDLVCNFHEKFKYLSKKYSVDLIEANYKRLNNRDIYFSKQTNKKIKPCLTDGKGIENHVNLRNFQVRQAISNMNGTWIHLLSKDDKKLIANKFDFLISEFGYKSLNEKYNSME
tara:strand:+ start:86 stop:859 length:774 start_codon:yes stop_codon:yes gene_type:complete